MAAGTGVAVLVAVVLLMSRGRGARPEQKEELKVAATIFPLQDIVRNVAGQEVQVVQLIPAGASPHSYSLNPGQLARARGAEVIFAIGHGLDNFAAERVSRSTGAVVKVVDEGIELRSFDGEHEHKDSHGEGIEPHSFDGEHEHKDSHGEGIEPHSFDGEHEHKDSHGGGENPHYWLTVSNAVKIAKNVAGSLKQIDPDNSEVYDRNLAEYLEHLNLLEKELQEMAGNIEQKNFAAIHDAWSYLAAQYGLNLAVTYEPREGQQPSAAELKELGEVLEKHDINTFYTEPQKQSTAAVRFLSEEFGLKIRVLDPLGGVGDRDSYIDMMRFNIESLAAG